MLSREYLHIYNIIASEIEIDKTILVNCLNYIEQLNSGFYVYTENLVENFNIAENDCLELLTLLNREEVLKKVYKLYCPNCRKFDEHTYNNISEINEVEICIKCNNEFDFEENPFKYLAIFFKKI